MYVTMKINVDVADNPVTGEAAVGIIVRDHGGNPQVMVWRLISNYRDAEEAEALACLERVRLFHQWPSHIQVELESDCAMVITKVSTNVRGCSIISVIIGDIKEIMRNHGNCEIQKVWREQIRITHNLAQFGLKSRSSTFSFSIVSLYIQDLVYNDRSRCTAGDIT
jgi:ribonuclease HI